MSTHTPESVKTEKKPVPRWVPVALLAATTTALAVPIVLLRRQQASLAAQSLASSVPPPRRTVSPGALSVTGHNTNAAPPPRRTSSREGLALSSTTSREPTISTSSPNIRTPEDDFNGPLYTAKAFGYATLIVGIGAVATVTGVKAALGVRDTQEFADRMRTLLSTKMPVLSSRIHRPVEPKDQPHDASILRSPHFTVQDSQSEWTWSEAEVRLKEAFERDGFTGWAEAAVKELELEGALERSNRRTS